MSAASIIDNIPRDKYDVICIGITRKGRWLFYPGDTQGILDGSWKTHPDCCTAILSPDRSHHGILKILNDGETQIQKVDCIFSALHGRNGEDGTMQGLFALSGIPYVGCDTLSSACAMDKEVTHILLDNAGIPTAPWMSATIECLADLDALAERVRARLSYPVFVKPANTGSSVGVSRAYDDVSFADAVKHAFTHDHKIVIEAQINGKELECAVLGNHDPDVSVVGEIIPCNEFYDYQAKYHGDSQLFIPARIEEEASNRIRETAAQAFRVLGCSGLTRMDFFLRENGDIILNEPNTLPGFTSISMYPKLWDACGLPYPQLLDRLITLGLERAEDLHG